MEVRIHFTHGLPSTNQVDLSMGRLQNPSSFSCSHSKESLCTKYGQNIMCLAVGICFSYSFVRRGMDLHAKAGHDSLKKQLCARKSCVCDPDFGGVTRPVQGLGKSQTGDFRLKYPMDAQGKHSTSIRNSSACCRFKVLSV